MSEILVIPDIHGRDFWKEPCNNWDGNIVFLGDYHDPYDFEYTTKESLQNLRELVKFAESRWNVGCDYQLIHCLRGNHDISYETGINPCRYDKKHEVEVLRLLNRLHLQFSYIHNGTDILFSHAGITKNWVDAFFKEKDTKYACLFPHYQNRCTSIYDGAYHQIPWSRGGHSSFGSCLWNSLEDFREQVPYSNCYQVFGHTWGGRTEPVITDTYAMLDCCKAFIIDTETKEITEWKNYQKKN